MRCLRKARSSDRLLGTIRKHPRYGLAAITAAHARSLNQAVAADPLPDEPAHGVAYGQKKRGGIGGKLRDGAEWVIRPIKSEAT